MRILIVDQCSGTKEYPESHPVVDQAETRDADPADLLDQLGIDGIQAADLYTGKQQQRISEAVRTLRQKTNEVSRVFISAGFGLVDAAARLPPYDATFNEMSKAEISDRAARFDLTTRLTDRIRDGDFDLIFFTLGSSYIDVLDLDAIISATPETATIVLFNQEEVADRFDNAVSISARTEEAKEFGSAVIGLKGTYLRNFAAAINADEEALLPSLAQEYCTTHQSDSSQTGIGNYE